MGEAKEASPAGAGRELAASARAKTFEPFLFGHFSGTFVNIQNRRIRPKAHMQENRRAIKVGGGRRHMFRRRFEPRDRRGIFSDNRRVNGRGRLHCILLHGEAHKRSPEVIQTAQRGQPRGWRSLRSNGSIAGQAMKGIHVDVHRYVCDIHNEIITLGFERGQGVFEGGLA